VDKAHGSRRDQSARRIPVGEEWRATRGCALSRDSRKTSSCRPALLETGRARHAAPGAMPASSGPMEPVSADEVKRLSVGDAKRCCCISGRSPAGRSHRVRAFVPGVRVDDGPGLTDPELLLPAYPHARNSTRLNLPMRATYTRGLPPSNGGDQEAAAEARRVRERCRRYCAAAVHRRAQSHPPMRKGRSARGVRQELRKDGDARSAGGGPPQSHVSRVRGRVRVPFDIGDYLYREFAAQEREFYRSVHALSLITTGANRQFSD